MIVHLIDGTYELFRVFYGLRRFHEQDPPFGAVLGVLGTVAQMLETGATHVGVATARLIDRHGAIEEFPDEVMGDQRDAALLFKKLATLRTDAALFGDVDALRWSGPTPAFDALMEEMGGQRLLDRVAKLAGHSAVGR